MSKQEYLNKLQKQLNRLPKEEIDAAISFYDEYISDSEKGEAAAIEELGSPAKVASGIIATFAIKDTKANPKRALNTVFLVLLAIFASPIALPIAIALFAVVLALIITMLSVFLALGVAGLSVALSGIVVAITAFWLIFSSTPTAIFFIGCGLVCFAIGTAMLIGIGFLAKKSVQGITRLISGIILRRNRS